MPPPNNGSAHADNLIEPALIFVIRTGYQSALFARRTSDILFVNFVRARQTFHGMKTKDNVFLAEFTYAEQHFSEDKENTATLKLYLVVTRAGQQPCAARSIFYKDF